MRYSVGAVAKVMGLTPGALHYYEREGLLSGGRMENGYRYYDDGDIWKLLSYEKYHSMGYPIKMVIDQFTGNATRAMIEARVRDRREEALAKSAYYKHLADSIDEHIKAHERIDELLDGYALERARALYFWHADNGWMSRNRRQQEIAAQWVGAMPTAQIAAVLDADAPDGKAVFGYSIIAGRAREIGFELPEDARLLPETSCLHTVVVCDNEFAFHPEIAFREGLAYCRERGFRVHSASVARVLLVETNKSGGPKNAYIDVWIPIA
ncbi:MAG: MerR family transcriptional regulator [Clostridia bacterium]|nr:MerR family transcriptional regulator [Clostridia bacterium]